MSTINIDVDDELVDEAMSRYRVTTKQEVVDLALRRLVGPRFSSEEFFALEGVGGEEEPGDSPGDDPPSARSAAI